MQAAASKFVSVAVVGAAAVLEEGAGAVLDDGAVWREHIRAASRAFGSWREHQGDPFAARRRHWRSFL